MPIAELVPRPIRIGAAIVVIAAVAYASSRTGTWWLELPAVVLIPIVWWLMVVFPHQVHGPDRIPFAEFPGRHRVTLCTPGRHHVRVVNVVRCTLGIGLGDADRLTRRYPTDLVTGVAADKAYEFASRLEAVGAAVTVGPT